MESKQCYALVTGASSGIGEEYARQLAVKGYNIIVVSNRAEDNCRVAEALKAEFGVEAEPLYADLSERDSAEQIYNWCTERNLDVEVLVSNAGILLFRQMCNTSSAMVDVITAVHCTTPAKLCRLFGESMRRRGGGYILLMSSMTAWLPYPTMAIYGATKAFLRNFGTSLWYEMRGSGVSVTTVFPGAVDTPLYSLNSRTRRLLRGCGVMMSAASLARIGLRAMFHRRRQSIPGLFTKISLAVCRILPAHALLLVLKIPAVRRILDRV